MKTHSQKFLQQRRFYMALPLLVLPFLTMIFWALGGGKGGELQAKEIKSGLNTELPGAHLTKGVEVWDKFSLYEQAKRDSIKMEEAKRNDPYYVMATLEEVKPDTLPDNRMNTSLGSKDKLSLSKDEQEITKRLETLTSQLNAEQLKPATKDKSPVNTLSPQPQEQLSQSSADVQQLEKMMQLMREDSSSDTEMQQIDGMLEKILDIQHPERVKEKIREQNRTQQKSTYAVTTRTIDSSGSDQNIEYNKVDSLRFNYPDDNVNIGFYGLDELNEIAAEENNAIEAVIHDNQTVVAGSIVKMRLLSDIFINNQLIPKDQFVYGTCAISGERLTIQINSIRENNSLYTVTMEAYDMDGLPGIYIPGAISRDVAKQSASQGIQDVQMYSMSNSLEVQAASAGIEAAKGLFSKKTKLIKVNLKAGYQILLKDKNNKA